MICFDLLLFFASASAAIANGATINANAMTTAVHAKNCFCVHVYLI